MPILTEANQEVRDTVERMVERYHPGLRDAGVTFRLMFARPKEDANGDPVGHAIAVAGYPALAKVKITPYEQRVGSDDRPGLPDCTITIDQDHWDMLTDREREALVDHELEHLELVEKTQNGHQVVQRDDADRPKMRIRRHDHQHGWFDAVVRRHAQAAPEWMQWEQFEEKRTQLWLPYMEEVEDEEEEELAHV